MSIFFKIYDYARELIRGLGVTGSHILKEPITESYPECPGELFPRFRGRHALQRYANGWERCVGCSLCAAVCPSNAIYVVASENDKNAPESPGERHAKIYEINMLRCIFCGFCAEACPVEAIVLRKDYELAEFNRSDEIYTKEMLLDPPEKGIEENKFTGGMGFENITVMDK